MENQHFHWVNQRTTWIFYGHFQVRKLSAFTRPGNGLRCPTPVVTGPVRPGPWNKSSNASTSMPMAGGVGWGKECRSGCHCVWWTPWFKGPKHRDSLGIGVEIFPLCFRRKFGKMTPEVRVRSINFDM